MKESSYMPARVQQAGTMPDQMCAPFRTLPSAPRGLLAGVLAAFALASAPALGMRSEPFVHLSGVSPVTSPGAAARSANPEVARLLARPASLWDRIRDGYAIPDLMNDPLVAQHERWWAARPALLGAILQRGRKYLYFIVEGLARRGMPLELALLPIVESGYNPMASSSAEALGLWQFIPATGARYNLAQNAQVDARRDVIASTGAALAYLESLYALHKDWQLALASYNWGEHAVLRAAKRVDAKGGTPSFDALSLPAETRHYVPRLQALKNIVARPEAYGIVLPEIANEPYFVTVRLPAAPRLDLATAAKLAEMTPDEFRALNPAFNPGPIAQRQIGHLALPVDRVEAFEANLARRAGR
jgi:membrane-bound lytic murein transglycosylase D